MKWLALLTILPLVWSQDLSAQSILHDIQSAATCTACESLLVLLQALAWTGDDNFVNTITELCILAKVEDYDVCQGAIGQQGPILAHDLREMVVGTHTSKVFCASIFGLCDYPKPRPYQVQLSPKPATLPPPPSGQPPLKVVHFSDIHVDRSYTVGANYNCTKPICCRPYTSGDAPGNTSYPAGPFGNGHCDSPVSLEESMYKAIRSIPDVAFSIFTGDLVEGAVWLVTEEENVGNIQDAYSRMTSLGLLYGTAGNHEAAPVNAFPPLNVSKTSQWVYDALAAAWQYWLGPSQRPGAYAVDFSSKLKIISFNSNLYYNKNFWLFEKVIQYDPDGQFAWLVQELQAAEDAGQRVYMMAHMPMGGSSALNDASNYFQQIVNRYSATIAAIFYGHTHKDQFEISYSDYSYLGPDTAIAISYIAPAMTPTSGNPSFRVYDVDPETFAVLDYTEYYTNVSSADFQQEPVWEKLYSAREAYGGDLTPASWHNVTELFVEDDVVFQEYYARKARTATATCDAACKAAEICQLRAGEAQYNCVAVKPGLNFKRKRDVAAAAHEEECEKSTAHDVFQAMVSDEEVLTKAVNLMRRAAKV